MLLVRQRGRYDCGVAVVAMVAQVPYEAVLDRLVTGLTTNAPLSELVVWRTLEDVTQTAWHIEELRQPWPELGSFHFSGSVMAVLIQRADDSRHYLGIRSGWLYDPLGEEPVVQAEHPDRSAGVVTVFSPRSKEVASLCSSAVNNSPTF